MDYTSKEIIDAACCGAFKRKSVEEANQLVEYLAKRNYRAPSETSRSSSRLRGGSAIELNRTIAIEENLDALMNKLGNQGRRSEHKSITDERLAHKGPYRVDKAQFISGNISYNFRHNTNLPTHYTLALRNHENFPYGGGAQQGKIHVQNYQKQYAPHGF